MVEAEDVTLAEDDPWPCLEHELLSDHLAVDVAERIQARHQGHHTCHINKVPGWPHLTHQHGTSINKQNIMSHQQGTRVTKQNIMAPTLSRLSHHHGQSSVGNIWQEYTIRIIIKDLRFVSITEVITVHRSKNRLSGDRFISLLGVSTPFYPTWFKIYLWIETHTFYLIQPAEFNSLKRVDSAPVYEADKTAYFNPQHLPCN